MDAIRRRRKLWPTLYESFKKCDKNPNFLEIVPCGNKGKKGKNMST